ncbi:response regulator [Pelagicoccus mobilis]|uniref:histidine kinase n=1 Tax=Pelagicoccus mobilis TaxID=415221 RepID=A0A934VKS5_9BACT|nr:response regulator [Pelagicoccus mobilis]MBK1876996.1 response regulator [Pelagicoccus mobilis]
MPKSSQSTILVVDDNLGARRSIEALLSNESYNFLLADSGQTALDLLEENIPDVILLDVMMPGMSGFEVCKRIREDRRVSEIPIIMITALDDEESMIEGIDAGADDFLSKPISKIELRSRIRSILRLNRFRKLCDERQKFELVVAQSHLGYVVINEEQRILFSNTAAKRMLGIAGSGLQPANFFETAQQSFLIQPNDIESKIRQTEQLSKLDPFMLVRSSQNDQVARWIRVTFQELGLNHGTQQLLRLEDISDRIVAFQEKHTFSRMISHKLLTPLNAIKAAHQLIKTSEPSVDRLTQIADIQQKGIKRLEYDIHSILSFLERDREPDKSLTILEAQAQIQQAVDTASFDFSLTVEEGFDASQTINISAHAFEACLREIVENAAKFHRGASAQLSCHVSKKEDESKVEFVFQNNSAPLSNEEIANAWKPYWQADRYVTGEIPGMGLGLSLIAANVWAAGGNCTIENHAASDMVQLTLSFPIID